MRRRVGVCVRAGSRREFDMTQSDVGMTPEARGGAPLQRREGSLEAPTRHVLRWQDPDFTDREKTEAEMRRIFDICHGCRRCFNLCESFPRLFELIDNSPTGELDGVPVSDSAGRRRLHAVRHVLHDEVPVRAAARIRSRFSARHAALPRGRAQGRPGALVAQTNSEKPTATARWRGFWRRWRIGGASATTS